MNGQYTLPDSDWTAGTYTARASQLFREHKIRGAQALLEEARRRFPSDAIILSQFGDCYKRLGYPKIAAEAYTAALEIRADERDSANLKKVLAAACVAEETAKSALVNKDLAWQLYEKTSYGNRPQPKL